MLWASQRPFRTRRAELSELIPYPTAEVGVELPRVTTQNVENSTLGFVAKTYCLPSVANITTSCRHQDQACPISRETDGCFLDSPPTSRAPACPAAELVLQNTSLQERSLRSLASATPRHGAFRDPERVNGAVVRRRWPCRWDLPSDGREHSQVCHERADILFVPVRCVVPNHTLPMKRAPVRSDAASNGSDDLSVGPRTDSSSCITADVASP